MSSTTHRSPLHSRLLAAAVSVAVASATLHTAFARPAPAPAPAPRGPRLTDAQKQAKAAEAYKAANDKYKAGDFEGALPGFREANQLAPDPRPQFKIADCLDKLGKTAEAKDEYQKFLAMPLTDKQADQKKLAEERVAALSKASVKISSTPAGATIKVNGEQQQSPAPTTLSLGAGKYTIELSAAGFAPFTKEIEVAAGGTTEINGELTALPPPPPPVASESAAPVASAPPAPPPKAEPRSKVPAYVTLGLGGAGLVVGTIFGLKALSSKSDFDKNPTNSGADKAEQNALIADMAFGIAVTLGVTGTVLLLSSGGEAEPSKAAAAKKAPKYGFTPVFTPQTQGAAGFIRF